MPERTGPNVPPEPAYQRLNFGGPRKSTNAGSELAKKVETRRFKARTEVQTSLPGEASNPSPLPDSFTSLQPGLRGSPRPGLSIERGYQNTVAFRAPPGLSTEQNLKTMVPLSS